MKQYVALLNRALNGEERLDRTGVGTRSTFGGQVEFDLQESFPLVTIKKTLWRAAFVEMLWFIRGEPNTKFLKDHGVNIWDEWADEQGNLGPIYGVQWRKWPGKLHHVSLSEVYKALDPRNEHRLHDVVKYENFIGQNEHRADNGEPIYIYQEHVDQLEQLIVRLKALPNGRRHIVTAWNPGYIKEMGLPPCHRDFQCYAANDGSLDLMMSIRSWDLGLGAPFNIAQYALLTHLIARATGRKARRLIINYGDAHVYLNHVEPISKLLAEYEPISCSPKLIVRTDNTNIDGYTIDDFDIEGYASGPFLKLPIAV